MKSLGEGQGENNGGLQVDLESEWPNNIKASSIAKKSLKQVRIRKVSSKRDIVSQVQQNAKINEAQLWKALTGKNEINTILKEKALVMEP